MHKIDWWQTQLQFCTNGLKHLTFGRSTCKSFPFVEQPLLVCWYVETFGHKFLHCGDLFIFSHLENPQNDNIVTQEFSFCLAEEYSNCRICSRSELLTLHQIYIKPRIREEFTASDKCTPTLVNGLFSTFFLQKINSHWPKVVVFIP